MIGQAPISKDVDVKGEEPSQTPSALP
jgi:hypothetical protein